MELSALMDTTGQVSRPRGQATRLAELVSHLTDCTSDEALLALFTPGHAAPQDEEEALARVARALVSIRRQ